VKEMAKGKSKSNKNKIKGEVPGTIKNQNLGHNAKKEGLGQNTNQ
jgi:hypothetical protein